MDKFKYQIVVLVVAILIGVGVGHVLTSSQSNKAIKQLTEEHAIQLKREIALSQRRIAEREAKIAHLDSLHVKDSLQVKTLEYKILQDGVRTENKRKEASKFTTNEKHKYLLDRYSN